VLQRNKPHVFLTFFSEELKTAILDPAGKTGQKPRRALRIALLAQTPAEMGARDPAERREFIPPFCELIVPKGFTKGGLALR